MIGNTSIPVDAAAMLGAIAIAYPFELARVLIVNQGANSSTFVGDVVATLRGVYANEGVAGLYRGFTPKALYMLPIMITFGEVMFPEEGYLNYLDKVKKPTIGSMQGSVLQPI